MGRTIRYYFSMAITFTRLSVQSGLEYPINLISWILVNPIQFILGFATIKFVIEQFGSLGGWGYESLAFLYGLAVLSHGFAVILFIQTWYMGRHIIHGEYDTFILRPMSVLFQFLFQYLNLIGISDLIPGLIVFIYGCMKVQFTCSIANILLVIITVIGGVLIRGSVWLFCGSLSFWTQSPTHFIDFTLELFDRVTMYPLSIYPRAIQVFFTFILPLGWITFYPTKDLLGLGGSVIPINMAFVTLGIGVLMFTLSCVFFNIGMRRYESAGS
ncbi:MAG: ABC-2 family transporter protein [Bacillota bacterium]|nr:ABC-2 family transporter protein [Bacillota bacterium]